MTDSRFFDSSAWLSYLHAINEDLKSIIESDKLIFTSVISLFEIKNKLIKDKMEIVKIQRSIDFIKNRSLIIEIDSEIAEKAVEFSIKHKLHTADSLIYASCLINNSLLITLDNDFRGMINVLVIEDVKKWKFYKLYKFLCF